MYRDEPATCDCLTCLAENPKGCTLTRGEKRLHQERQARNAPAFQRRGAPRGVGFHQTSSQRSSINSRGRPGGPKPTKRARTGSAYQEARASMPAGLPAATYNSAETNTLPIEVHNEVSLLTRYLIRSHRLLSDSIYPPTPMNWQALHTLRLVH
jgi:hypothetical protein